MRRLPTAVAIVVLLVLAPAALPSQPDPVLRVRVADVGPGLCTITRAPGGAVMVYDAGHWVGRHCIEAVQATVPGDTIHLMILSHSDSDHVGSAAEILTRYTVRHVVWTGNRRPGVQTWENANRAIAEEVLYEGATVRSLGTHPLTPGETLPLGPATVTFLAGWSDWPERRGLSPAELQNVISIVVRVDWEGGSVLYGGDTVGRRTGDPPDACKDAEAWMVRNHREGIASLRSDVIIAPHHGADNGSATCFIEAVNPQWVVFSAGNIHQHPRAATAERYLAAGVPLTHIFRTDLGDDEGGTEWAEGRVAGCRSPRGAADVEIELRPGGNVTAFYLRPQGGC